MDLCCGECYYSCLKFVPIYVSVCVGQFLLNAYAIMCGLGDCFICESYCIVMKCVALWLMCLCY